MRRGRDSRRLVSVVNHLPRYRIESRAAGHRRLVCGDADVTVAAMYTLARLLQIAGLTIPLDGDRRPTEQQHHRRQAAGVSRRVGASFYDGPTAATLLGRTRPEAAIVSQFGSLARPSEWPNSIIERSGTRNSLALDNSCPLFPLFVNRVWFRCWRGIHWRCSDQPPLFLGNRVAIWVYRCPPGRTDAHRKSNVVSGATSSTVGTGACTGCRSQLGRSDRYLSRTDCGQVGSRCGTG